MAIDPKIAVGGAATAIIGSGAGFAVHAGTSHSETSKAGQRSKIKNIFQRSGFGIDEETPECRKAKEDFEKNGNYKKLIVSCSQLKTFKAKAAQFGLDPLSMEKVTDDNDQDWKNKWSKNADAIKALKKESSNSWTKAKDGASEIKALCNKEDPFTESTTTEDWHQFLKVCIKEDEDEYKRLEKALTRDFWTDETTTRAKLKNLGFVVNESENGCKNKLDEDGFDLEEILKVCYKDKKFSDRAKAMGLDVMDSNTTDLENGGWKEEWKLHKKSMATLVTKGTEKEWANAKDEVKTYCTTDNQGNKTINENSTDEDWKNFIKVCTKDKAEANGTKAKVERESFWTTLEINW